MIGRIRLYIDRSSWYLAKANTPMIFIILLKSYGIELTFWEIVLSFAVTYVFLVIGGFIDVKLGFLKSEQDKYGKENPVLQEILKEVRDAKKT